MAPADAQRNAPRGPRLLGVPVPFHAFGFGAGWSRPLLSDLPAPAPAAAVVPADPGVVLGSRPARPDDPPAGDAHPVAA